MKVFRVVTERDGETTREPGKTSTKIVTSEYRYAAETIQDVWIAAVDLVSGDGEQTIIAVHEEHPAITILRTDAAGDSKS
jgi:hypothetical protein